MGDWDLIEFVDHYTGRLNLEDLWTRAIRGAIFGGQNHIVYKICSPDQEYAYDVNDGLYFAVRDGNTALVDYFLAKTTSRLSSAILGASESNRVAMINDLLNIASNCKFSYSDSTNMYFGNNWRDECLAYGLIGAAKCGHKHLVEVFTDKVLDVMDDVDWTMDVALGNAVFGGHDEVLEVLLSKEATSSNLGEEATRNGHLSTLTILISRGLVPREEGGAFLFTRRQKKGLQSYCRIFREVRHLTVFDI